jgi:hypothetical protein
MFRGDYTTYYLNGKVTPAQMLSIPIFVAGVLLWWVLSGSKSKVQSSKP